MNKLIQTRLHKPPKQYGNCFPTVIACIMGLDSPEDVIQIQEHYEKHEWPEILNKWLFEKGYELYDLKGHLMTGQYYFVTGKTERSAANGSVHICIYQNGKLFHDPHPSNTGIN